jgi:hypothetical protein
MGSLKEIEPDEFTTLTEFDKAIKFVAEECTRIEMQVTSAKGAAIQYGEYADSDWYARANAALRIAKAMKQELARKRADLARTIKDAQHVARSRTREKMFIDACREMLPHETYAAVWLRVDAMENGR